MEIPEELAHEGLVPQPSSRYVPHHRGKPRTAASARAENPHEPVCSELVHDLHCGRLGREWQSTEKGAFVGLANRNKNKKRAGEFRKNERKYILSGFVQCSICGYACNGRTSTSRVSGSPKKYAYYSCASNRAYPGGAAPPTALLTSPPTGWRTLYGLTCGRSLRTPEWSWNVSAPRGSTPTPHSMNLKPDAMT